MSDVYLAGKYMGTVDDAAKFTADLRTQRRAGIVSRNVNVYHDESSDSVHVEPLRGRVRRPLIVVRDGQTLLSEEHIRKLQKNELTWNDLIRQGVIEYLDAAEEENTYVAFSKADLTAE